MTHHVFILRKKNAFHNEENNTHKIKIKQLSSDIIRKHVLSNGPVHITTLYTGKHGDKYV